MDNVLLSKIHEYGLTEEQYENCLNDICQKVNKTIDLDWQEIVEKYNLKIHYDTMRKASQTIFGSAFVYEYLKNKLMSDNNDSISDNIKKLQNSYNAETNINKDGSYSSSRLLEMDAEQSKDPDFILKAHGFNPNYWKIVSARNTIRQAISREEGVATLYASFITVKPIAEKELPLGKIEEFFNKLDRNYSLPDFKDIVNENSLCSCNDKLLLIDIADLHMNLQASMFTTGNEYNCDIAEKLFFNVIGDILTRTQSCNFEEIVFCIGGDALNADNLSGTTTKGTPQDNDIHYYDAYERLCAMTIKAIDILKEKCKVNVIYVMGNHDELAGFKLAKYIDAWFRNDKRVDVDYQPIARKYKLYGKTLMCFAHDGKTQKLPAIIADEARQYWSQVDTVEVFLQHLHTEQVLMEDNNIRIQRLPTISGRSKWASDKGYNSKRQCKTFIFDREDGLTDVLYTSIKKGGG